MKIEHYESGIPTKKGEVPNVKDVFKKHAPLILGAIALIAALSLLPMGFFINISLDVLGGVLEENLTHYTVIFVTVSALIAVISVVLAAISIFLFKKSEKGVQDAMGVILSVISFCVCTLAIILIILGLLIW